MPVPTPTKVWQFAVNQIITPNTGQVVAARALMWAIKQSLVGFAVSPWTVWGSCNGAGAFGNGDAVDRWVTSSNLIWAAAGSNHSWIVLTQPGLSALGPKAAICIDLSNATYSNATITLSPDAGFGAANGGTDGTATARPTASDQITLCNNTGWGATTVAGELMYLHVLQDRSGQCTRVITSQANAMAHLGFWSLDRLADAIAPWTNPVHGLVIGSTSDRITFGNLSTSTANSRGRIVADAVNLTWTGLAFGPSMLCVADQYPFVEVDGEWTMSDIGVYCTTVGHRGRKGRLPDVWWVGAEPNIRHFAASGIPFSFAKFGCIALPWNGELPLM